MIVMTDDSAEVIPVIDFYLRAKKIEPGEASPYTSVAMVKYMPNRDTGPLKGLIELWITESAFVTADAIYSKQPLTQEQTDRAYAALITYANADPNMAEYRPGQPPQTRFSIVLLGQTLLRLIALFGIPTIVALIWKWVVDTNISKRHETRRLAGICISCEYPCATTPSLRCPECGQFHTIPHQPPANSNDQPSA